MDLPGPAAYPEAFRDTMGQGASVRTLLLLMACGTAPAPVVPDPVDQIPVRVPADPSLDTLTAWLTAMGLSVERHGDILRFAAPGAEGPMPVTAQVFADDHIVFLASPPLAELSEAEDPGGVGRLLAELAVRNYAATEGKLQLDPERGRVLLSIELETDDGLARSTLEAAVRKLVEQAEASRGPLRRALRRP